MENKVLALAFSALLSAQILQPAVAQNDAAKGLYRVQPPYTQQEPQIKLPSADLESKVLEHADKSLVLGKGVGEAILAHVAAAGNYDIEAFAKNDDHLADLYDQWDANILDWQSLAQLNQKSKQSLSQARAQLKKSKQFSYKSSALFYLCLGQPLQTIHYARLALAMAKSQQQNLNPIPNPSSNPTSTPSSNPSPNPTASQTQFPNPEVNELLFLAGSGYIWSADYDNARPAFNGALTSSWSDYAYYYIGEIYLAKRDYAGAVSWLNEAKQHVSADAQGHIERSLALAYTLMKDQKSAKRHIELARDELIKVITASGPQVKTGGPEAVCRESLGIVEALAGNYKQAQGNLTEALSGLTLSPLKMGNRLEASQAFLWRSYCRYKLGDKSGAREDRDLAMRFIDEANHFAYLARNLDQVFNMENVSFPPSAPPGDRYAVVIGLSKFADERVPRLRFSAKDASDVGEFLEREAGFTRDNIKVLLDSDATGSAIRETISTWLPARVKPADIVFFFISSHGTPAYGDIGALNSVVAYDTKLDQLFATTIPMQGILREVRSKLKKQRTFVVLDTCYSGGLGAPDGSTSANIDPDLMVNSNLQLLVSSSDTNERSWESKRYKNSVFTRQLINELQKNLSYKDFHDIFVSVQNEVEQEVSADWRSKQTPRLSGKWNGLGLAKKH